MGHRQSWQGANNQRPVLQSKTCHGYSCCANIIAKMRPRNEYGMLCCIAWQLRLLHQALNPADAHAKLSIARLAAALRTWPQRPVVGFIAAGSYQDGVRLHEPTAQGPKFPPIRFGIVTVLAESGWIRCSFERQAVADAIHLSSIDRNWKASLMHN